MARKLNYDDLKTLHKMVMHVQEWIDYEAASDELAGAILESMKKAGYNKAFLENGYDLSEVEGLASDSVVPGFCFYCLNETSVEPDAHYECHECEHGYVKSLPVIMGVM